MNNIFLFLQNNNMKTKYKVNNNELVVNFDFLYKFKDNQNKIKNLRKYINKLIIDNNIKQNINKIIVYKNGLLIGVFYLTNYYLKKLNYYPKNNLFSAKNSYFYKINTIEIS